MELIHVPYIEQQVHPLPCFWSNFIVSNNWSMSLEVSDGVLVELFASWFISEESLLACCILYCLAKDDGACLDKHI